MVVEHGGEQIVGRPDGVEITRKVQVDVLHGNDLRVSAAGRTTLDAEDGPEGRLTQRNDHVLANLAHAIGQAHRRGGLALARRRRRDGRHEDELAVWLVGIVPEHRDVVDLGHVAAVGLEVLLVDARLRGDLDNGLHLACLRDFDIRRHMLSFSSARPTMRRRHAFSFHVTRPCDAIDIPHR